MVSPMTDGVSHTVTPAAASGFLLFRRRPLPPLMIAPACPMRLPGGAVAPAMKPTTGLVTCLDEVGRLFLARASDLTDHDDALGLRVVLEQLEHVDEVRAVIGSPPIRRNSTGPSPADVDCQTAS